MRAIIRNLAILATFPVVLLTFQNCTGSSGGSGASSPSGTSANLSSGGGVYDGMTFRYIDRQTGVCADGSQASNVITVAPDGSANIVRLGCQSIQTSLLATLLNMKPYNPMNLIYKSQVFTLENVTSTTMLCRGSYAESSLAQLTEVDIVLTSDASGSATTEVADLKVGVYDPSGSNLLNTYASQDVALSINTTFAPGQITYALPPGTTQSSMNLLIAVSAMPQADGSYAGQALFLNIPNAVEGGAPLGVADNINVNCYLAQ